ncbi:hypothetical protein niasHT_031795 [Heterodera trifolii]|uniref:Insulin-like domain-containing protein n=1 Tax=Heterodera trifolii TaxID=157864 RepID=A0ABD2IPU3_9BILA
MGAHSFRVPPRQNAIVTGEVRDRPGRAGGGPRITIELEHMTMALNSVGQQQRTTGTTAAQQSATIGGNSFNRRIASQSGSPRFRFLPFLFILLLLSSAPNALEGAGGFRLCGLKLTMMLNAICKQQLCGGFVLTKKRSPTSSSLPVDFAQILMAPNGRNDEKLVGRQSEAMLRHHLVVPSVPTDWARDGEEEAEAEEHLSASPAGQQGLRWAKRGSYPYKIFGTTKKSGIATECCSKRCTLSYMKTYCCATPLARMRSGNNNHNIDEEEEGEEEEGNEHGHGLGHGLGLGLGHEHGHGLGHGRSMDGDDMEEQK